MANYNPTQSELDNINNTKDPISVKMWDFDGNKTKSTGLNDAQSIDTFIAFLEERKKVLNITD